MSAVHSTQVDSQDVNATDVARRRAAIRRLLVHAIEQGRQMAQEEQQKAPPQSVAAGRDEAHETEENADERTASA
jgi:hypothetical protein